MECNVGKIDMGIRLVVIVLFLLILTFNWTTLGFWKWVLLVLSVMLIYTVLTRFCLPYKLIGISTCEKKVSAPKRKKRK